MRRLLASFASAALLATLFAFTTPQPASAMDAMKCATGQTYVKAYKKADGTKVAGYCRTSEMASPSSMMMTCPKGESMVKGYTKADGTKVAAYCRKK